MATRNEDTRKQELTPKTRAYWSVDLQAFYLDGSAWGVNKSLRTVYIGKEEEVLKKHPAGARRKCRH